MSLTTALLLALFRSSANLFRSFLSRLTADDEVNRWQKVSAMPHP